MIRFNQCQVFHGLTRIDDGRELHDIIPHT
jgi:hypothetical protein